MGIGVSGPSESSHKKDLGIQTPREKKGILAGAIAGANIPVVFDKRGNSLISEASKNQAISASKGKGGLRKAIASRKAHSTVRPKKAKGKAARRAGRSKRSGAAQDIEDLEETSETPETEEKNLFEITESDESSKEEHQEGKREQLFAKLRLLAEEGQTSDLQNIIDAAWGKNGVYEDVTEAYDGLRAAQKHFSESDVELLQDLSDSTLAAGDILYRENKPDILTGYLFGPGTPETLSYREYVLRFKKVSETFTAIMEKVEGNSRLFIKETDKLIKGIQIDLKAQESTLDPNHLRQIMRSLFTVQMCSQLEKECDFLLRDMHTFYGIPTIESVGFAKKLLDFSEATWIDASEFEPFAQMVDIKPGKEKVDFSQRFLAIIKRLPEKLVNLERKQKLIEAGQEYLDQAIEEEDRLEEQQDNQNNS